MKGAAAAMQRCHSAKLVRPYVYLCTGYEAMAGKPVRLSKEMSGTFWMEPGHEAYGLFPQFAESLRKYEARSTKHEARSRSRSTKREAEARSTKHEALGTTRLNAFQTRRGIIKAMFDDAGDGDGIEWITVNGVYFPLRNGEPANDVGKRYLRKAVESVGKQSQARVAQRQGIQAHPALAQRRQPAQESLDIQPAQEQLGSSPQGGQERLEFTQEQLDNPRKDNPLTPEQVQTVRRLLREQFPGMETLPESDIQCEAERALCTGDKTLQGVVDWLQEF